MATNAEEQVVDDDKKVTEEDLRKAKYGEDDVEESQDSDEASDEESTEEDTEEAGEDDGQTDDQAEDEESEEEAEAESDEESSEFVKEFPNIKGDTLDEYTRQLETAYKNSTAEAMRLKAENDSLKVAQTTGAVGDVDEVQADQVDLSNPTDLWAKQKLNEEIQTAYSDFQKEYSQTEDPTQYAAFEATVRTLSQTILQNEGRLASPSELYKKSAVILGWEPNNKVDGKEKLGIALKSKAAVSKASSPASKKAPKSKVTDKMIAINRMMYPDKTDDEIRKELEPYVK